MGKQNKNLHMATFLLLVAGGLNWLLIGLFKLDVVAELGDTVARIVYILVGASAIYELATHKSSCKTCSASMPTPSSESHSDQPPMQNQQ